MTTTKTTRVVPPKCEHCGRDPWLCPSCGDYQCACHVAWMGESKLAKKLPIRVHYNKQGVPYRERFIDGFVTSADGPPDEEIAGLISL